MHSFLLPLDSPDATLADAGGKGLNLAKLARAGFPVPDGFIVATAAYRAFVAANHLAEWLPATASAAHVDDPAALEATSQVIRRALRCGCVAGRAGGCRGRGLRRAGPATGRGALLRHRRRPARHELRRPAGHLPECRGRGGLVERGRRLLEQPVDRTRHRLSCAQRHLPRRGGAGRGRAGDGAKRGGGRALHRQSLDRQARRNDHRRHAGPGRGVGGRPCDAGQLRGGHRCRSDHPQDSGRQSRRHPRSGRRRHASRPRRLRPIDKPCPMRRSWSWLDWARKSRRSFSLGNRRTSSGRGPGAGSICCNRAPSHRFSRCRTSAARRGRRCKSSSRSTMFRGCSIRSRRWGKTRFRLVLVAFFRAFGYRYNLDNQREMVVAGERVYINYTPALRHPTFRPL